ncbi:hypothetical protein [Salinisphaera orenii]|uniref:hypothetical protein n=1 Tax=Salinisphaera orenii TaxID=856731 RepID=UPI000DBE4907
MANAQSTDYCHNAKSNKNWSALAKKHQNSDLWQRLYALRIGLCSLVARNRLSRERASQIFERQRDAGLRRLERQNQGASGMQTTALQAE